MPRIVLLVYAVFIACISLMPLSGGAIGQWDKAVHLAMYGVFAVLGYWAVRQPRAFFYLCIALVAYGGLMEILQSLTPGRMMSAYDFVANTLGVMLGALLARTLLPAAVRATGRGR